MCMDEDLIFIGCADGIVRCFRAGKLDFIATLPLPHHLGVHVWILSTLQFFLFCGEIIIIKYLILYDLFV